MINNSPYFTVIFAILAALFFVLPISLYSQNSCPKVTEQSVSNIGETSATLQWSASPAHESFDVDVMQGAQTSNFKFSTKTTADEQIVDGLELSGPGLEDYPPTWAFDVVAVGQSGDIYISGGGKNVIYRVSKN